MKPLDKMRALVIVKPMTWCGGGRMEIKPEIREVREEKLAALKLLVKMYYKVQRERVGMGQRITDFKKFYPEAEAELTALSDVFEASESIEKKILKKVKPMVKDFEIYSLWLKHVRGIAEILAAGLISGIKTASRFPNVSKLWHYCGYHVVAGEAPRRKVGARVDWSPFLRTTCWKIGESFVRAGKYYRKAYEAFKAEEEEKNKVPRLIPVEKSAGKVPVDGRIRELAKKKDKTGRTVYVIDEIVIRKLKREGIGEVDVLLTPRHVHERAKRKTVKLFLAHLWIVWRELEGLEVPKPYVNAILGHSNYIKPPMPKEGGI